MNKLLFNTTISIAGVVLLLSSCSQSESTRSVTAVETKAVDATQADWKTYTDKANEALKNGDKSAAEQNYKAAIAEAEKLGQKDPALAEAVANAASFYYVQGDGEQADELYQRSLSIREAAKGMEDADLITDLLGLFRVRVSQKKFAEACKYYERAKAIAAKTGKEIGADADAEYDNAKKLISEPAP